MTSQRVTSRAKVKVVSRKLEDGSTKEYRYTRQEGEEELPQKASGKADKTALREEATRLTAGVPYA